jgi:hypothetical protein
MDILLFVDLDALCHFVLWSKIQTSRCATSGLLHALNSHGTRSFQALSGIAIFAMDEITRDRARRVSGALSRRKKISTFDFMPASGERWQHTHLVLVRDISSGSRDSLWAFDRSELADMGQRVGCREGLDVCKLRQTSRLTGSAASCVDACFNTALSLLVVVWYTDWVW